MEKTSNVFVLTNLIFQERKAGSTLWKRLLAVPQKCESFFPEHMVDYIPQLSLQLDVAVQLINGMWAEV